MSAASSTLERDPELIDAKASTLFQWRYPNSSAAAPAVLSSPAPMRRSPRASPRPSDCRAAAALCCTPPSSQFCTGLSGFCDDVIHSPCTASALSGSAGGLYTHPPIATTAFHCYFCTNVLERRYRRPLRQRGHRHRPKPIPCVAHTIHHQADGTVPVLADHE